MKKLLKTFFIFGVVIALLVGIFSLYAHFLMDYSLDSLTQVAVAAHPPDIRSEKMSNTAQNLYQNIIQDMAVEQIAEGASDYENLSLLDLAARSLDEAHYRAGFARAGIYLNQVLVNKKPQRHFLLQRADAIVKKIMSGWESVLMFARYAIQKFLKVKSPEKVQLEEYASALLLNQAQDKERQGFLAQAEADYKKFLKAYPANENRSLVILSLATVLMRERKFKEAENFLIETRAELFGKPENELARQIRKRLLNIQTQEDRIKKMKMKLRKAGSDNARQTMMLQLAVMQMSVYDFEGASSVLETLLLSDDIAIKQKAVFYTGWIYKFRENYEKSAEIFSSLLKDPLLTSDLELGARAQLADVYYKKGDAKKSAAEYQAISNKTLMKKFSGVTTAHSAWASFSEVELVNIYTFDFKNNREVRERLDKLINMADSGVDISSLGASIDQAGKLTLRDLGFHAIMERKLTRALDFFTKYLAKHPDDGLTLTGLATVYALMGDLNSALTYARKGYQQQASEYSTLMLGYTESLKGNYDEAISKYSEVLLTSPNSTAAKYNLAYVYLKKLQFHKSLEIMNPLEQSLLALSDRSFLRAKTLNNIGYCYWGLNDNIKAMEWFRKAYELSPELVLAKNNLAALQAGSAPTAAKPTD